MARDYQQAKLYQALLAAAKSHPTFAENISTEEKAVELVRGILKSPWMKEIYSTYYFNEFTVDFVKREHEAYSRCRRLYENHVRVELGLPKWAHTKLMFLRFLAFALAPKGVAWSGAEVCSILIFLVKNAFGNYEASVLVAKFTEHKVSFRPYPRIPTVESQLKTMQVQRRLSSGSYW